MTGGPTVSRRQKCAALTLLVGAIVVLSACVVAPIGMSIVEAREAIAADAERLKTLRAKRVDLAGLEAALQSSKADAARRPLLIEAPSSAGAWERLQAAINELSSAHDATPGSGRMLRQDDEAGLKAIRGEFVLQVSRAQLSRLIRSVERRTPLIFIERLQVEEARGGEDRLRVTAAVRSLAVIVQTQASR